MRIQAGKSLGHSGFIGHIKSLFQHLMALLAQAFRRLRQALGIHAIQHHPGASLGQRLGNSQTQATRRTRHQGGTASQIKQRVGHVGANSNNKG